MTAPTTQQRQAINTRGRALVVDAGAGTGKTWVLVERFLHLLDEHPKWPLESLVAITFTEKATREMRSRIRAAVEAQARSAPSGSHWHARRGSLERLRISTIHGLCARLLHENAIAAGIDPQFTVLDEQEADLLQAEAVQQTLATLAGEDSPILDLLASIRVADLRRELGNLLGQRGTVHHLFENLPDTTALLARWTDGLEVMRLTVWAEILREYPDLEPAIGEIRSSSIVDLEDKLAPAVILAQTGAGYLAEGDLAAAGTEWLEISLVGGKANNWGGKPALADLKETLRRLRSAAQTLERAGALQEMGPADELAAGTLHLWEALWLRLEETYSRLKDERGAVDFDDLEILTLRLLDMPQGGERLRAALIEINHLMVDEFQDTNETQGQIVERLAPAGDPGRLFVVGDAKQSIYRFRQAQVAVFNRTKDMIERLTGESGVSLNHSFRSHGGLVAALNHLFDQILQPASNHYEPYEAQPGPLSAERAAPEHTQKQPPVELLLLPAKDSEGQAIRAEEGRLFEAQLLAERLKALRAEAFRVWDKNLEGGAYRPFEFSDAAILFRATTSLPLYEAEFKKAGLPYLTVSGRGFYDRPEVQDLIALLNALNNPANDLSLATALRSPLFSLSDETLYRLRWHHPVAEESGVAAGDPIRSPAEDPDLEPGSPETSGHRPESASTATDTVSFADPPFGYAQALAAPPFTDQPERAAAASRIWQQLRAIAGRVDVWALLRTAMDLTGYEAAIALADKDQGATGRRLQNVQKFLGLARDRGGVSLSEFLRRIRDLRDREAREGEAPGAEPSAGAVQLMSIHAAKGLEFPVVALADLGRQNRRGAFGSPLLLHDPAFGLVCKYRDENGDWQEPAGYRWGKWLDGRMEAAESKRLLYVACTRAADLLVLSGKTGAKNSWLAEILQAWELEPDGDPDEVVWIQDFSLGIRRPEYDPAELADPAMQPMPGRGVSDMPSMAQLHDFSGTAAAADGEHRPDLSKVRPAVWPEAEAGQPGAARGYSVEKLLRAALADWAVLALPDPELAARLASIARRDGIIDPDLQKQAAARAREALHRLGRSSLFDEIRRAEARHTALPFTLQTPVGPSHGQIDLLYRDGNGTWRVIRWITRWVEQDEIDRNVEERLPEIASQVAAVQTTLGERPQVLICFLRPAFVKKQLSTGRLHLNLSGLDGPKVPPDSNDLLE